MTAPLTPPDCDLRDFQFMPLDVVRFAQSDLVAMEEPNAVLAAILLWGASWHGVPAGSLTDDDRALSQAAGYGRAVKEWMKVRDGALRGWVKCDDGRLYHPVVAEKANDAWEGKLRQRHRTYCAAIRKHNERHKADQREAPTFEAWIADGRPTSLVSMSRPTGPNVTRDKVAVSRPSHTEIRSKGQGEGQGQGDIEEESFALPAPEKPEPAAGPSPSEIRAAFDQWNALARRIGLPSARDFTDDRRKKIATRLRTVGADGWASVLATIEASEFCRGGGDRGWRISLEDLFQTKTWNKLRDGGYGAVVRPGADEIKPEVWARLVANWRRGEPWPSSAGPAPDQPETRVPARLLIGPADAANTNDPNLRIAR